MLPVVGHEVRTGRWPYVTVCLVGLNIIVFAFEATVGVRFVPFLQEWGLVPARVNAEITLHNMLTVGTSMFLHVSLIHLIGNVWFLYVFGDSLEDALGPWWYLFLYLAAGFFGTMAFIATSSHTASPVVGASGAISGVLGASLVIWPRARLKIPAVFLLLFVLLVSYQLQIALGVPGWALGGPVLFIVGVVTTFLLTRGGRGFIASLRHNTEVPAWVVLGLYLAMNLFSGMLSLVASQYAQSVGWWAHIAGFAAGALFGALFPKHPRELPERRTLG